MHTTTTAAADQTAPHRDLLERLRIHCEPNSADSGLLADLISSLVPPCQLEASMPQDVLEHLIECFKADCETWDGEKADVLELGWTPQDVADKELTITRTWDWIGHPQAEAPIPMPPRSELACGCQHHGVLPQCPIHDTQASPFNIHPEGRPL